MLKTHLFENLSIMRYLSRLSYTNLLDLTNLSIMSLLGDTYLPWWEINVHNSKKKKVSILSRPKSKGLLRHIICNCKNRDRSSENGLLPVCWISFQEALMSHYKLGTNYQKFFFCLNSCIIPLWSQITSSVISQITSWHHALFSEFFFYYSRGKQSCSFPTLHWKK